MNEKDEVYSFIKKFSKTSLIDICKKLNINYENVLKNKTTIENLKKVKQAILIKLLELCKDGVEKNETNLL